MPRKKSKSRSKSAETAYESVSRKRVLPNCVLAFLLGAVLMAGAFLLLDKDSPASFRQRSSSLSTIGQTNSVVGKRSVNQLLALSDDELEKVDILELNLAVAREIPDLEKLDYNHYQRIVDEWTAQFAQWLPTVEMEVYQRSPAKWKNDINFLRLGLLCNYLTEQVGIRYVEKYSQDQKQGKTSRYTDPGALFLHGLIDTKRGTCASMPNLHIAIGQRMGWPVSLACVHPHYICRYDDGKVHYNIEGTYTGPGFVCDSDEEYMKANNLSKRAKTSGSDFRSLSARETLGAFISARARHYRDTNRPDLADRDYALSRALFPNHRYIYVESIRPFLWRGRQMFESWESGHPCYLARFLASRYLAPNRNTRLAGRSAFQPPNIYRDPLAEVERINAINRANMQRMMQPPKMPQPPHMPHMHQPRYPMPRHPVPPHHGQPQRR